MRKKLAKTDSQGPNRRSFLKSAAAGTAGLFLHPWLPAEAVQPFDRQGPPRLRLSLAAYSFRDYFVHSRHERETPIAPGRKRDLTMTGFLDYCAEQDCPGAELTSYYFPQDISNVELLKVKRHSFLRGMTVTGTAVGNTFTHPKGKERDREIRYVKTWIDRATFMGASHLRVFAGTVQPGSSFKEAKMLCLDALEECADYAGQKGVFLGIENHGGIVAESDALLEIIRETKNPWVGINLDTGNFHTDNPYRDLERCAPYAVNVQLKVELKPRNRSAQKTDLKRIVNMLKDVRYQGSVVLEYESAEDPWVAVPRHLDELRQLL